MCIEEELKKCEEDRKEKECERQMRLEQMRRGKLEEIKLVGQTASDWNKARRIRGFADEMESKISNVADEKIKPNFKSEWLEQGIRLIG